eukprot:4255188-Amphidinium_carterae.1
MLWNSSCDSLTAHVLEVAAIAPKLGRIRRHDLAMVVPNVILSRRDCQFDAMELSEDCTGPAPWRWQCIATFG